MPHSFLLSDFYLLYSIRTIWWRDLHRFFFLDLVQLWLERFTVRILFRNSLTPFFCRVEELLPFFLTLVKLWLNTFPARALSTDSCNSFFCRASERVDEEIFVEYSGSSGALAGEIPSKSSLYRLLRFLLLQRILTNWWRDFQRFYCL